MLSCFISWTSLNPSPFSKSWALQLATTFSCNSFPIVSIPYSEGAAYGSSTGLLPLHTHTHTHSQGTGLVLTHRVISLGVFETVLLLSVTLRMGIVNYMKRHRPRLLLFMQSSRFSFVLLYKVTQRKWVQYYFNKQELIKCTKDENLQRLLKVKFCNKNQSQRRMWRLFRKGWRTNIYHWLYIIFSYLRSKSAIYLSCFRLAIVLSLIFCHFSRLVLSYKSYKILSLIKIIYIFKLYSIWIKILNNDFVRFWSKIMRYLLVSDYPKSKLCPAACHAFL